MGRAATHIAERAKHPYRVWHREHRACHLGDRRGTRAEIGIKQVAYMHEADDVVDGISDNWVARMGRLAQFAYRAMGRHLTGQEVNRGTRHPDLAAVARAGCKNVVDDPALLVAKSGRAADHGTDLLMRHFFTRHGGVT